MKREIDRYRAEIAKKVREIRRDRLWTQRQLAELLGMSQNRLSEIETGKGSLTAEQLIHLSKSFNVPIGAFISSTGKAYQKIQNALARHGAAHLMENQTALPSEALEDAAAAVYETLVASDSPRQIAGLGPVLVNYATFSFLSRLKIRFTEAGLITRLGWLLDNTRFATEKELVEDLSAEWRRTYVRADRVLEHVLGLSWFSPQGERVLDVLESTISHPMTLEEVRESSSSISKKWRIITRIGTEDFVEAMKNARESAFSVHPPAKST